MKWFIQVGEINVRCDANGRNPRRVADKQILIGVAHITSVRPVEQNYGNGLTIFGAEIEYVGAAGYHTRQSVVSENFDVVRALVGEAT